MADLNMPAFNSVWHYHQQRLFCLQNKAVVVVDVALGLLHSCCVTAQLLFDHHGHGRSKVLHWWIRWDMDHSTSISQCNLLFLVADRTNTKHKVVFQNKLVNGNWKMLSPACVQPPDAYQVSFHYDGNDALARQFDNVRAFGTGAFVRSDGGVSIEPTDFDAIMDRYSPLWGEMAVLSIDDRPRTS